LLAIGACAVSVYGSLIGITFLLLQRADVAAFAWLVAAVAAAPVWLRFLRLGIEPSAGSR
jgi:hypothetical protein